MVLPKKPKEISITDQIKDIFRKEIETKGAPTDKASFDEMKKIPWSDENLKLTEGSRSSTKKHLSQIMKEKGFKIPEGIGEKARSSSESEGIVSDFVGEAKRTIQGITGENNNSDQNKGTGIFQNLQNKVTSPITTGQGDTGEKLTETKPRPQLAPEKKQSYVRLFKKGFSIPKNMMIKTGFAEGDEEKEEKPQTFSQEVDGFAEDLAIYCFEENIPLPKILKLIMILGAGLMIFGVPIVSKLASGNKDKNKDSKKEKEHHKLSENLHGDKK